ncbi:MAG TPA: GreA/GreB family elongation factor [Flavobacteriaceae bacterium]|nr:GreA/GreB family elongation factor [Flavobacteriaceae bacterium]
MKYGTLILEKKEHELLKKYFLNASAQPDPSYRASASKLSEELKSAKIVSEKEMPDDIIRFGSMVTIQTPFGPEKTYQLVRPEESDIAQHKISILAPMGTALIGYAKGDEIEWQFPSGMNSLKITHVEPKKRQAHEQ